VTTSPDPSEATKALTPALRAGGVAGSLALLAVGYLRFYRPWQLRWGATEEEAGRTMPGDGVVQRPTFDATRAVSIAAPPECIYPWLVQIGVGRAGWYSYDLLDNLGRPSAEVILQEHQHLDIGDVVPMSPDGLQGMKVLDFRANDWLVWGDVAGDTTWTWGLYPGEGSTRLVSRVRMRYRWTSPTIAFALLVEFFDLVMMRKAMLGIKRRAEALAQNTDQPRSTDPV
jgi:hypothetical protein